MSRRRRLTTGAFVAVIVGVATAVAVTRWPERGLEVRLEDVRRRDLVAVVTASGNVRARRTVDLSSDVSARVAELLVREGDDVRSGRVLIRLDPTQFQAVLSRARAALSQARAQSSQQEATLLRAERDYERLSSLSGRDSALVSRQQLQDAATNVQVARASLEAARHFVEQARASVAEADDRLAKTVLRAPIDGRITRLQVEEGETVIIGTMNTPGSLILTISDLSVMEVVVQVDETDVPRLAFGDSASVAIDAFPEETLTGRVTEIGNSALRPPSSQAATGEQAAIDFEVVLTLEQPPVPLRPDLSATADIVVDARDRVVAVPIIALTVRPAADTLLGDRARERRRVLGFGRNRNEPDVEPGIARAGEDEVEGAFLMNARRVRFVPVSVGIAGDEYFEVLSGVAPGDTVVAGPYTTIRELRSGDRVRELDLSND